MEAGTTIDGYSVEPELLKRAPTLLEYPVKVRSFQQGEAVIRFQEPIRELQIMAEGQAKVFTCMENGRAALHTMFQDFAVIGDLELLRGYSLATTDVVAMTKVVLFCIPLDSCQKQLLSDAHMLRLLGEELAKKLERNSRQTARNLLYPLSARLAAYMLFSAQEGIFEENLTQVSELMATSYRHLLRTLKGFCQCGAIDRAPRGYRILDAERLALEGKSLRWDEGAEQAAF